MNKPDLKLIEGGPPPHDETAVPEPHEQTEMPFAVVEGEPVTQMPRDLYIPPEALTVFLEAFEGPLDLLLYLIRRQNLDILDIPIAEITRQYLRYIDLMRELQLELAGEYLLMAATRLAPVSGCSPAITVSASPTSRTAAPAAATPRSHSVARATAPGRGWSACPAAAGPDSASGPAPTGPFRAPDGGYRVDPQAGKPVSCRPLQVPRSPVAQSVERVTVNH